LARFFVEQYNRKFGRNIEGIAIDADEIMVRYCWPGNVRELRKAVERAMVLEESFSEEGMTYGTPSWIWSVAVGDALYLRGYNGTKSRWYQAALRENARRIIAAGMTKEVSFEPAGGSINDSVDNAYRAKYGGSPYLKPMIGAPARAAKVKIMPLDVNG
jgi:hypothetical protein